jgi:hypothetical protein
VRRLLLGVALSILLTSSLASAQVCPGLSQPLKAVGFQALTVSTAAVGFTVPPTAELAVLSQEGADIRWRDDGVDPTASVGVFNATGNGMMICSRSLAPIRFIRAAGVDALLSTVFYGR